MMKQTILSILALAMVACGPYQKKDLIGKWQGVKVMEEGKPLNLDAGEINFAFYPNAGYTFTSTLNYQEAGTFSIDGHLLYTRDTLNENAKEKAVEIREASRDTLVFSMKDKGKDRLLILKKIKR